MVRRRLPGLFAAAALIGLAACQVGPDYRGPPSGAVVNAPAAGGPFVSATPGVFSAEAAPDGWWRLYRSPELDRLVSQAFAANTDLRMAAANLERSQALLREARASRQPTAEISFDPSYQQLSAEGYLHPGALHPSGLYDTELAVSYDLDLFGRLRRIVESATAKDEAVKAAYDLARVNVAAETARAFADACGAGEALLVAEHALALQTQSAAVTRHLVQGGRAAALDAVRSEGEVAQIRSTIPGLEAQRRNALYRLAIITGHPPAEYPKAVELCAAAPILRIAVPVGDGAALLRRRPDVREAERDLAAATADIGVATADLYPRATLGATIGSTGLLSDFLRGPTNRFGLGPGIVWEAKRSLAHARVAEAGATARLALARFDGVVLAALQETESALTTYRHDLQRDGDLMTVEARAAQAEQLSQRLYLGGKVGALTLLDAQRTRAAADAALAASHAQLAADQVAIFLALGGGWG